jgi:hypothetical protein
MRLNSFVRRLPAKATVGALVPSKTMFAPGLTANQRSRSSPAKQLWVSSCRHASASSPLSVGNAGLHGGASENGITNIPSLEVELATGRHFHDWALSLASHLATEISPPAEPKHPAGFAHTPPGPPLSAWKSEVTRYEVTKCCGATASAPLSCAPLPGMTLRTIPGFLLLRMAVATSSISATYGYAPQFVLCVFGGTTPGCPPK